MQASVYIVVKYISWQLPPLDIHVPPVPVSIANSSTLAYSFQLSLT
jgi:hypothetical protein